MAVIRPVCPPRSPTCCKPPGPPLLLGCCKAYSLMTLVDREAAIASPLEGPAMSKTYGGSSRLPGAAAAAPECSLRWLPCRAVTRVQRD